MMFSKKGWGRLKWLIVFMCLSSLLLFNNCTRISSNSSPTPSSPGAASLGCFEQLSVNNEWSNEVEVPIDGYSLNAMEPKISADQVVLFFNNKTLDDLEMDVNYAVKQSNGRFAYAGVLPGTASSPASLDGVPSLDVNNNFYFTSLRDYGIGGRYRTLFAGQLALAPGNTGLIVNSVAHADVNLDPGENGIIDMDADVSWDGSVALVSRARFSGNKGYPDTSYLAMYNVVSRLFSPFPNGENILKNVNLSACRVYAPNLSSDMKELYYAVLAEKTPGVFDFRIVVSKRANTSDSFGVGSVISVIPANSLAEAPSISFDDGGKTLYYHRKDAATDRFKIYKVTRLKTHKTPEKVAA